MFAIANGRKSLWQWDLNQQLTVAGSCTEVHYLDKGSPSTLTVAVKDGKADIPNILLQRPGRLVVYAYIVDAQDHHTKICEAFGILARPKPAEYVYTETEVKTWSDLQSQIGDLADLATEKKDNLVAAINEAARSGGGGAGAWYVTLTPNEDISITADKTMAEIEAAYQAGYAVYCIFLWNLIFAVIPIIAPLTVHRQNTQYVFCGVGTLNSKLYSFQFELTESGWTVSQKEIPQKSDIPEAYILPKATANALGGVKADPAMANDTQPVRIDQSGKLVTAAGSGSSGEVWELINTSVVPAETTKFTITQDLAGKPFAYYELKYVIQAAVPSDKQDVIVWFSCQSRTTKNASVKVNGTIANQIIVGYASSLGGFVGGGLSLTVQSDVFSYNFNDTVSISKLTMFQMYASNANLYLPQGTKVALFGRGK